MDATVNSTFSSCISRLLMSARTVSVLPDRDYAVSLAEDFVISTRPIQRLRSLRQMGLAYHAHPLAEHTRFSHSIGTCYWASELFEALTSNQNENSAANRSAIEQLRAILGETVSLELLIKMFALIHDIALLPLGHTLRFQIEHTHTASTFRDGLRLCLAQIFEAIDNDRQSGSLNSHERDVLKQHLALAEAVAHAPKLLRGHKLMEPLDGTLGIGDAEIHKALTALTFVYDLVHGVYSADLIDVCCRDLGAVGAPWVFPESLAHAGAISVAQAGTPAFPTNEPSSIASVFRYGIDCRMGAGRGRSNLLDLISVHRSRLELAQKGFYAVRKCIADAMLEKAIRDQNTQSIGSLESLLGMGDDDLLLHVAEQGNDQGRSLISRIRNGTLYEVAFMVDTSRPEALEKFAAFAETSSGKTELEAMIVQGAGISENGVVVSILPSKMQGKSATTLVRLVDDEWLPLNEVSARTGLFPEMSSFELQYQQLRYGIVLIKPEDRDKVKEVRRYCEECLG
ncbi:HD superfamily phosphohydrolase [Agrobacterium tumefaciens]|uniref:HD superfamily phosphohydrolase n=1 Tax=Agrobacterium radiobacter TaxID=362 RepID=A0ABR6JCM3_AGRRD|nr:hypothetical protein [Agrobacterium radiobacter]MBB4320472.1 HD superfamily phosphohydrolase [Agrobacterium radiobacter]MBB4337137.1 HD superfamily phosphohydrolase [Agrobacterium radiobacter]MBB4492615.1 HD superfamily phosphohydrolase [Agrobacterium radiobacter]MBB4497513.1 HD superfamily phosphohydrolase [Agrobacterium radiobacter]MBB4502576.1 HD superfamily phosphohydrolase [Agrobacterium radiobacter]